MTDWRPIGSAPRNASEFRARMSDGTEITPVHWAEDMSGEYQPPFRGWFTPKHGSDGRFERFVEIDTPKEWAPLHTPAPPTEA
jgi:hypothetical protein